MPLCSEYAVFAKNYIWPATQLGEEKLIMVLRPQEATQFQRIYSELLKRNQQLADHKRVHEYIIWHNEFPRTASLK
jgi:hypothetical protein